MHLGNDHPFSSTRAGPYRSEIRIESGTGGGARTPRRGDDPKLDIIQPLLYTASMCLGQTSVSFFADDFRIFNRYFARPFRSIA